MRQVELEWDHRTTPHRILSRASSRDSGLGFPPSLADCAPGPTAVDVQQALAERVEVEEEHHQPAIQRPERQVAADQLVVVDSAVGEAHGSMRRYFHSLAAGQAWSQNHRVEEIVVAANVGADGSVVERARKG